MHIEGPTTFSLRDLDRDGVQDFLLVVADASGVEIVAASSRRLAALWCMRVADEGLTAGVDVASVRDLDEDGIDDVLVGVVPASFERASGAVTVSPKRGFALVVSGRTGDELKRLDSGTAASEGFGRSVAPMYDLDADGRGDLAVAAPAVARVYVFSGRLDEEANSIAAIEIGRAAHASVWGSSMTLVSDASRPRLLIGAPSGDSSHPGSVSILEGRPPTESLRIVSSERSLSAFGTHVRPAHDADRDGVSDVLIAAPGRGARLCSGASGAWLASMETPIGSQSGEGRTCAAIGDVNGDEVPDYALGAKDVWCGEVGPTGYVRVYSGADGDLLAVRVFDGGGVDVAAIGDLDGDGVRDLLVHRPLLAAVQTLSGRDLAGLRTVEVAALRKGR